MATSVANSVHTEGNLGLSSSSFPKDIGVLGSGWKSPRRHVQPLDPKHPIETGPSFRRSSLPHQEDVERFKNLTKPHVESFNYFLDVGLARGIRDIDPVEMDLLPPALLRSLALEEDGAQLKFQNAMHEVTTIKIWVENIKIGKPTRDSGMGRTGGNALLPRECRERSLVYAGPITGNLCYTIIERRNGIVVNRTRAPTKMVKNFGSMPIMVGTKACHLDGLTPEQLIAYREESYEAGGYFIVNGNERCIRMLQIPRRNHPTSIQRSNYKNRGPTYTDLGVAIRCARHNGDMSSITNTVHYLTTGGASLRFTARKQEFLIPVILIVRALSGAHVRAQSADAAGGGADMGITDEELYHRIVQGDDNNTFLKARAELLLQDARTRFPRLNTPKECLAYIGSRFRRVSMKAESTGNIEIGKYILRKFVLIHLVDDGDKLECLLLLLRKLYSFAAGDSGVDNADSLQNQEILTPGHLICAFVKEKFEETLAGIRLGFIQEMRKDYGRTTNRLASGDNQYWSRMVDRFGGFRTAGGIGNKVKHFLSTGNIISTTGLDLMQVSGYTIVAERLNFLRYCAHFRSVHRGQFFMEMKTTAVRKLLPDQWGFMCPVHTPDGGPCGLLSHLSILTTILSYPDNAQMQSFKDPPAKVAKREKWIDLDRLLVSLGVSPVGVGGQPGEGRGRAIYSDLVVCLNGRVVGSAPPALCKTIATHLRKLKVEDDSGIPRTLEVALEPAASAAGAPYPGLYLFSGAARLVRPVLQRTTGKTEMIGPMEQSFMDIACLDEDIREGITTHQELNPTNMLSLIANLTPFSDQNQSPRNMYQCQMGKQTMGTPAHSLPYRPDNKLYRLQTPQAPLVQTATHGEYKMDEYPNGTNAVVAVLSYTGFDMEDAMILNKSAYNRGFGHASVYKTMEVDLKEEAKMDGIRDGGLYKFGNPIKFDRKEGVHKFAYNSLGSEGAPEVGELIEEGDVIYTVVDGSTGKDHAKKHKEKEKAYVQMVRAVGGDSNNPADTKLSITLRFPRNPVIGDKFSSRHGQKGILSILWPQEDMPFSESGISPDVIINPHAFPSRMTIGMLVESMAGKSGALHGFYQDATPFSFHETSSEKVSVDYFGEQLQAAGYNYYGSEPLYSGVSGCLMQADLFIGVVYYQRLRHMVSDKYQVRATGPVNPLTRQPIKGRKKGGGIRLGEMERDSLLSHGAAFLLHDRLLNCSDKHVAYACCRCGDLLLPTTQRSAVLSAGQSSTEAIQKAKLRLYCRNPQCIEASAKHSQSANAHHADSHDEAGNDEAVEPIVLPYVYRYLVNELAAMNISIKLEIN